MTRAGPGGPWDTCGEIRQAHPRPLEMGGPLTPHAGGNSPLASGAPGDRCLPRRTRQALRPVPRPWWSPEARSHKRAGRVTENGVRAPHEARNDLCDVSSVVFGIVCRRYHVFTVAMATEIE